MSQEAGHPNRKNAAGLKSFQERVGVDEALALLGVSRGSPNHGGSLPFRDGDVTAGSESELQAVIVGGADSSDLPLTIRESSFFTNAALSAARGDMPRKVLSGLVGYLESNKENVWENSWARFPRGVLSEYAHRVLERDLLADKADPASAPRGDSDSFFFTKNGEEWLRLPISYLLKLALADVIGSSPDAPAAIQRSATRLLGHFLNDNTSPETYSFHVSAMDIESGMGRAVARETAIRYLLSQLLTIYANKKFMLAENGQRAMVFHSPHPPIRQKRLNELVPDSFYRELFMSPCLSGWNRGEEKHKYMRLCHEVLSRSQMNTLGKLREAGIITRNLVVLPNVSNISLANNGTHVSIGSVKLTAAMDDTGSGFREAHEKCLGDLAIKTVEHFLPLFVGVYTCSPYRMDFPDFHPERAMGFLPHELHYTHLRMIWRRWKKKARLKIFSMPITPFGPELLDKAFNSIFGLRGDYIPDYRLTDYLVALMSTETSPALDGTAGSEERLKKDLMSMGVFDERMSLYMLYKLRRHSVMGFSGFEGRHYSLFHDHMEDMAEAVNMQTLLTAFAFKMMADGGIRHEDIPDTPFVESERRQIFFGAAIGIPTFFVRENTPNAFLMSILRRTRGVRSSGRYPGYLRVRLREYQKALLATINEEAQDLVENMGLGVTLARLAAKLDNFDELSSTAKTTRGILDDTGFKSPFSVNAAEFNLGAERYFRGALRTSHFKEALRELKSGFDGGCALHSGVPQEIRDALHSTLNGMDARAFIDSMTDRLPEELVSLDEVIKLIHLTILDAERSAAKHARIINGMSKTTPTNNDAASVY